MSDLEKYFIFLDDLRDSGTTNMFGASSYLESEFEIGKKEAIDVLCKWMETFDENKTADERAKS